MLVELAVKTFALALRHSPTLDPKLLLLSSSCRLENIPASIPIPSKWRVFQQSVQRQSEGTGNICAAAFTHDASRVLDPQLHTHFVIANATRSQTGKWYALNEYEMVRAIRYVGKVYQNEMARAVMELGYAIRQSAGKWRNHRL